MILALAGTRPGEATALRVGDIDFAGLTLQIERAVSKSGHGGVPKDGDRRMVDLHPRLVPVLKRVARELKEDALGRGQAWDESAYLSATSTGRPLDLANVEKALKRVFRAMAAPGQEPPRHVLYDLRFATTLLAKGVPVTYVSSQLGHSNPSTTFKHYAHWLPRPDRRYVDQLLAPDEPTRLAGRGATGGR